MTNRQWGSEPPGNAADMLRWLATLSYESIAEHASRFVSDKDLFGKGDSGPSSDALDPKEAVFSVS